MDDREAAKTLREMDGVIRNAEQMDAVGLAIEALEKQIPTRPDVIGSITRRFVCMDCGIDVDTKDHYYNYCRNCGQKIDWEVEYTDFKRTV